MIGLYVHIPFCTRKCGYCDFYSVKYDEAAARLYQNEVKRRISELDITYDTVYFGGGTPSVIQSGVADILSAVSFSENAEITTECNPETAGAQFFESVSEAGVNRVSIGLQSANTDELLFLTRPHSAKDVKAAVDSALACGINNISLDVMLGFLGQTAGTLKNTLDFCIGSGAKHISAYMLKIEQGTLFSKRGGIALPDDETVRLYEFCCEYLEQNGFLQYEISNFARPGYECRHNLIYWNCDDYIGLGPAAHSLYKGGRYHFDRDLAAFTAGAQPIFDGDGGTLDEYIMLRLRLCEGLIFDELYNRGFALPDSFAEKCRTLEQNGLMVVDDRGARLTKRGFLVQNSVLAYLI